MRVSLIAAMARNQVIGRNNQLPWRLPADLKHFKQVTMGKPLIMGRRTFESIGRPLPGRTNIVLTRDESFSADGVTIVYTINDALSEAEAHLDESKEVMVMGGADIYYQFLPRADRMYLTLVELEVAGDAHFPAYVPDEWELVEASRFEADEKNPYNYQFLTFDRVPA
ncbi:MAG: type 3 dihydrofolate reductase [Guyparkeria sp.]|uniref:type 3 dihydrofolate reductase n=1 Tax=Guyparkeria sp. TaxID=2035736 RepID=UPI00397923AB